jgi:hypothetical protein
MKTTKNTTKPAKNATKTVRTNAETVNKTKQIEQTVLKTIPSIGNLIDAMPTPATAIAVGAVCGAIIGAGVALHKSQSKNPSKKPQNQAEITQDLVSVAKSLFGLFQ